MQAKARKRERRQRSAGCITGCSSSVGPSKAREVQAILELSVRQDYLELAALEPSRMPRLRKAGNSMRSI